MEQLEDFIAGLNKLSREHGISIRRDYNGSYLYDDEAGERIADGPTWRRGEQQYEWYDLPDNGSESDDVVWEVPKVRLYKDKS